MQEEATRGVCMAVMAASLRIINLLCTACPDAGVAAAVAAGLMPKLLFLSMPCDEDARVLSREVRNRKQQNKKEKIYTYICVYIEDSRVLSREVCDRNIYIYVYIYVCIAEHRQPNTDATRLCE